MTVTLKTLATATEQAIFDQVTTHMLTQMARSEKHITEDGHSATYCTYRGEDGRKCAVGALIADDEYHPLMDNTGDVYMMNDAGYLGDIDETRLEFLYSLQHIHDAEHPDLWAAELSNVAKKRGLTFTPPTVGH